MKLNEWKVSKDGVQSVLGPNVVKYGPESKNQANVKQHPEDEHLASMSRKNVCLFQWHYTINWKENENDNSKIYQINKIQIDQDLDIVTNMYRKYIVPR